VPGGHGLKPNFIFKIFFRGTAFRGRGGGQNYGGRRPPAPLFLLRNNHQRAQNYAPSWEQRRSVRCYNPHAPSSTSGRQNSNFSNGCKIRWTTSSKPVINSIGWVARELALLSGLSGSSTVLGGQAVSVWACGHVSRMLPAFSKNPGKRPPPVFLPYSDNLINSRAAAGQTAGYGKKTGTPNSGAMGGIIYILPPRQPTLGGSGLGRTVIRHKFRLAAHEGRWFFVLKTECKGTLQTGWHHPRGAKWVWTKGSGFGGGLAVYKDRQDIYSHPWGGIFAGRNIGRGKGGTGRLLDGGGVGGRLALTSIYYNSNNFAGVGISAYGARRPPNIAYAERARILRQKPIHSPLGCFVRQTENNTRHQITSFDLSNMDVTCFRNKAAGICCPPGGRAGQDNKF